MYMHEKHVCFACMECYTNLLTHMGEYGVEYVCVKAAAGGGGKQPSEDSGVPYF
jgi:hypothetical protein